jgi:hypothetical protein
MHHFLEARAFPPEFLSAFRMVPDAGIFEFPRDLRQPLALGIEVKDTP